jgi:mannose-1-phosphate guanylyltransferase
VLAGGAGTRLWPASTADRPKHLLELVGEGTLLQQTLDRLGDHDLFEAPIIVCADGQSEAIVEDALASRLIVEPMPRGSAAAIALAASAVAPDTVLLILPSDHHLANVHPLLDAVRRALPVAREGLLVTFGICPGRPETGYGYIVAGKAISNGIFEAQSFVEKPDVATAEQLLRTGTAYWNSGMFLFRAEAFLDELERHAAAINSAARNAMAAAVADGSRLRPASAPLEKCPATSIDYAVMEHSDRIAVVPVDLDWSDVGSWAAVYELAAKDADGNVVGEGSRAIDSRNCLIRSEGPKVVAIGVEDLVIIATADGVIVVPRSESQRVREAAETPRSDS